MGSTADKAGESQDSPASRTARALELVQATPPDREILDILRYTVEEDGPGLDSGLARAAAVASERGAFELAVDLAAWVEGEPGQRAAYSLIVDALSAQGRLNEFDALLGSIPREK